MKTLANHFVRGLVFLIPIAVPIYIFGSSPKIPGGERSPSASLRAPAHARGRSPHACQMAVM